MRPFRVLFGFQYGVSYMYRGRVKPPNLLTNQALIVVDNLILNKFHTIGYFTPIINNCILCEIYGIFPARSVH